MGQTKERIMETQSVQRICAWCKVVMGTKEIPDGSMNAPTHGICEECYDKWMGDLNDVKINVGSRL